MADNKANFTDEDTYETVDDNYRGMIANDEHENDGVTIEYFDSDLENETLEEYLRDTISPGESKFPDHGSAAPKPRYEAESKIAPKFKPINVKPATNVSERSVSRTGPSTGTSVNRAGAKRTADCLASSDVHAAVDSINARLADSVKGVNGAAAKKSSTSNGIPTHGARSSIEDSSNVDDKSEMDSLDLFFQSMAQTVRTLPSQVQARIKMDIYKVIATAEIKHCSSIAVEDVGGA